MENFVITIARQYGSGGRTVGKMLAEKLGVSFYDKQIIQMASDESGIDVKLLFRRDLSRLKGLDQVTAQVRSLVDGMAAGPGKFNIRRFGGTAIGGYKQFSVRLFRVADIINGRFQR